MKRTASRSSTPWCPFRKLCQRPATGTVRSVSLLSQPVVERIIGGFQFDDECEDGADARERAPAVRQRSACRGGRRGVMTS
jgi:hypothetical protein